MPEIAPLPPALLAALRAALTLVLGLLLARLASGLLGRLPARASRVPLVQFARRLAWWAVFGAALATALGQLGLDLTVFLGAAGVLTVAAGFASQTSASNLVSGLFLAMERSIAVGDVLDVGGTVGEVLSIDLLSVRLRTFDNLLVRIPNETLVKGAFRNLSAFPIRRVDVTLRLAASRDLDAARERLLAAARDCPGVLGEPPPEVHLLGLEAARVEMRLSAWAERADFLAVRDALVAAAREVVAGPAQGSASAANSPS